MDVKTSSDFFELAQQKIKKIEGDYFLLIDKVSETNNNADDVRKYNIKHIQEKISYFQYQLGVLNMKGVSYLEENRSAIEDTYRELSESLANAKRFLT
jgi:hypothetical protein